MVDLDVPASERESQIEAFESDPEEHTRLSFRRLVSIGKDSPVIMRAALLANEHHLLPDDNDENCSLLANLIRITDRFEHLVSWPDETGRLRTTQKAVDICLAEASETTRPMIEMLAKIVSESSAA